MVAQTQTLQPTHTVFTFAFNHKIIHIYPKNHIETLENTQGFKKKIMPNPYNDKEIMDILIIMEFYLTA